MECENLAFNCSSVWTLQTEIRYLLYAYERLLSGKYLESNIGEIKRYLKNIEFLINDDMSENGKEILKKIKSDLDKLSVRDGKIFYEQETFDARTHLSNLNNFIVLLQDKFAIKYNEECKYDWYNGRIDQLILPLSTALKNFETEEIKFKCLIYKELQKNDNLAQL